MDDTASILSSDSSSIWGVDPQEGREGGRGGGRDNTIPPQYQMNQNASSLMMMFPSPGSSSATSAVSGVSSGSNSGNSSNNNNNDGNAAATAAAAAPLGGAILLPPGAVKKAKAAGGGTRRKLGGGGGGSSSSSSSGGGGGSGGGSVGAQAQALSDAMAGVETTSLGSFFSSGAEGGGGREGGMGGGVPTGKRKQDRNAREQKRSLKISQQIGHLKTVLEKEGRKVKKNSKMAILLSVEDYIKELEEEIAGMTLMGGGKEGGKEGGGAGAGFEWGGICTATAGAAAAVEGGREEEKSNCSTATVVTVVREGEGGREVASGVGYQSLFKQVSTPLAVASVDGRLIDANVRFEMATGYSKEELSRLTFFNLVAPEDLQATFATVAQMINQEGEEEEEGEDGREEGQEPLRLTRRAMPKGGGGGGQLYITISLVKQQGQSPSFFQCSLH
jgi:PAS domain S-box-containing protein